MFINLEVYGNFYPKILPILNIFLADENIVLKLNERFADANWHVKENTTEHHTNEYVRTDNSLVLRRGQSFKVRNLGLGPETDRKFQSNQTLNPYFF